MASRYGNHDAACCARNFSAMALALAGESAASRAVAEQSLAAARGLNDPFSLALTLFFTAAAAQMHGDLLLATRNSRLGLEIATEHDLALPKAWSAGMLGWCTAASGDIDRGIGLLEEAIAALEATQSRHFLSYLLALLAEARIKVGNDAGAMAAVKDGLALVEAAGERFYAAELHRLEGELLARSSDSGLGAAELAFRAAVTLAGQQGAATLERAAQDSLRRWLG